MPAELLTLSKAGPNRKLRPRNETIPPRLSLLRGLDRPLGMGFSRENLVAGFVAVPAAGRGVSENIGHGWHSFPGDRHHHAPAANRLCYRPYWWVASRVIDGSLEIFVSILTGFGLGQLLHYGRELSALDQVIGIMLVIVVIGLLADKILFSPIERFLHRRWGTNP